MSTSTRHAEHKIPDGKLVVVDLQTSNGVLTHVQLSGDFFMEPTDTLDTINAALTALPEDAPHNTIIRQINTAITDETLLYGITVKGIAVVIERALGRTDEH